MTPPKQQRRQASASAFRATIYQTIKALRAAGESLVVTSRGGNVLVTPHDVDVPGTTVSAMSVELRNVAGENWGFYTREESRMHIQALNTKGRKGPKTKVWLEDRGQRAFHVDDQAGFLDKNSLKALYSAVEANLEAIESDWVCWWAMGLNKVHAAVEDTDVVVTMYPGVLHYTYERRVPLSEVFPGLARQEPWLTTPYVADVDGTVGLVQVGPVTRPMDKRMSFDVVPYIFKGPLPPRPKL